MKIIRTLAPLLLGFAVVGCSEQTKQESREALDATKEAAKSAAEDAKVNAKKAVEVGKTAVDKAKEEFSDPPANPPADADANGVPDAQETTPSS